MRCLAVCQDELVIRMLDEILLPGFEVEFIVENRPLARRLHDAGVTVITGDPRRTDTFLKADIGPGTCVIIEDNGRRSPRKILDAALAKGLTGWRPAWDRSYEIVMASLADFLEVDAVDVRGEPATAPAAAELGFGFDGDPVVEFRVSDDVVVRLRGSIDRLDTSADGGTVSVVDYKSGRSSGFAEKLGKPKKDGTPREREKVQDLVYDAAAQVLFPAAQRIDVHFVFVPNGGEYPAVVTPTHDPHRALVLRELLLRLETAGQTGSFLPTPQGTRDYCPVCKRLGRRAQIVSGRVPTDNEEETS